ncbi:MAG: D-alanyl-D-alanine carboxypeptidase [Treponema sp.]|jgi:D-alanyl-D-alanine carboxypeptidase (penicillin-binding protein 5/6)|nr:D-alanyl-D-alanine carboxypeptidase [Treponema sp.]
MKRIKYCAFAALLFVCNFFSVWAQEYRLFPGAPVLGSRAAVVMDASTGTIVFYKNPDEKIPPASLTKLMTMHLAFRGIVEGRLSLDGYVYPPRQSWAVNQPPFSSLMHLANGQRLTLRELLLGLAVFSGNDAAVATALLAAPSVEDFVKMMNAEAASLGLTKTRFDEPSGISELNMTTAREFAEFCRFYLQTYPEALKNYHSVFSFTYPKEENMLEAYRSELKTRTQWNRNTLLGRVEGVDGLKTGYIDEAGYNLALTARRNGTRFIAVILGAPAELGGDEIRDEDGKNILNWAFENYHTVSPPAIELEPVRVWKGNHTYTKLMAKEPLEFTAPAGRANNLYAKAEINERLMAPLPAGSLAGELVIYDDKGELYRISLVTEAVVEKGGFFRRLIDSIMLFFRKK